MSWRLRHSVCRHSPLLAILLSGGIAIESLAQPAPRLAIAPQPELRTMGRPGAELLEVRAGRLLDDGSIVVADAGDTHLHYFNARGAAVRDFGRNGTGPGEIESINNLLRCGDTLVAIEASGQASLFTNAGQFVRRFRFAAHAGGMPVRRTACNARMQFVHTGWVAPQDMKPVRSRGSVPLWMTSSVPQVERTLGMIPGDESVLIMVNGQPRGIRPQPMGYEQLLAFGSTGIWTLDTEQNTAIRWSARGDSVGAVRIEARRAPPSARDIDAAMREEGDRNVTAALKASYASFDFSKPLPIARALLLDDSERLWIELFGRADQSVRTWQVHDTRARRTDVVTMPLAWTLLDVRRGSMLVRVRNADDSEEVRVYRLSR